MRSLCLLLPLALLFAGIVADIEYLPDDYKQHTVKEPRSDDIPDGNTTPPVNTSLYEWVTYLCLVLFCFAIFGAVFRCCRECMRRKRVHAVAERRSTRAANGLGRARHHRHDE